MCLISLSFVPSVQDCVPTQPFKLTLSLLAWQDATVATKEYMLANTSH